MTQGIIHANLEERIARLLKRVGNLKNQIGDLFQLKQWIKHTEFGITPNIDIDVIILHFLGFAL